MDAGGLRDDRAGNLSDVLADAGERMVQILQWNNHRSPDGYADKRDFTLIDALKQGLGSLDVPIIYDPQRHGHA